MPREETIAGLRTVLAGGSDRGGGGDGPLLCLLHGYGANGDDLAGLWRVLDVPRDVRFAFPEAPLSLSQLFGFHSYAWWHIDVERYSRALGQARDAAGQPAAAQALQALFEEEPEGLPAARARVMDWLEGLQALLRVPSGRLVLGGFSQGAMLATDVVLHRGERLAGLVQLSGALINRPAWERLLAAAPPVPRFQSHGLQDPILPFVAGQALHELLQPRWPGTFYRFHGGHEISPGALDALGAAVTGWLQEPAQA